VSLENQQVENTVTQHILIDLNSSP